MFLRITRRSILGTLARLLPFALFPGFVARIVHAAEAVPDGQPVLLPSVIRELFPHAGLGDDFYAGIAGTLWQQILADPGKLRDVDSGLAQLGSCCCSGGWEHAARDARIAALMEMQNETFFQTLKGGALELMYRDPRVWERIGYGGNALAQGGYLTRGFDQIDWLPAVNP